MANGFDSTTSAAVGLVRVTSLSLRLSAHWCVPLYHTAILPRLKVNFLPDMVIEPVACLPPAVYPNLTVTLLVAVSALAVLSIICPAEGDSAIAPSVVARASRKTKTNFVCLNAIIGVMCNESKQLKDGRCLRLFFGRLAVVGTFRRTHWNSSTLRENTFQLHSVHLYLARFIAAGRAYNTAGFHLVNNFSGAVISDLEASL